MAKLKTGRALSSAALNYLSEQFGGDARGKMVTDPETKTREWVPNPSAKSADQEIMEDLSTPDELAKNLAGIGRSGVTGKKGLRAQMRDEKNPTLIKSEDLTTEQQDKKAQKMQLVKELVSEITSGLSTYQNRKEGKFPVVRRLEKLLATKSIGDLNNLAKAYSEGKIHVLDGKPSNMPKVEKDTSDYFVADKLGEERSPAEIKNVMKMLHNIHTKSDPVNQKGVPIERHTQDYLNQLEGRKGDYKGKTFPVSPMSNPVDPTAAVRAAEKRSVNQTKKRVRDAEQDEFLTDAEKALIAQALARRY